MSSPDFPAYPNDPTGDALRMIAEGGSDMSQPMEIEYHIFVPDQPTGHAVSEVLREKGYDVELWCDEEDEGWTCTCYRNMLATHEGITAFEGELEAWCEPLGATPDGWGTFGNGEEEVTEAGQA